MVKGNPEVWGLNSKAKIAINCHGEDKERLEVKVKDWDMLT